MTKELSMQELLDQQEQLLNSIKVGDTITGTITKVNNDELTPEEKMVSAQIYEWAMAMQKKQEVLTLQ